MERAGAEEGAKTRARQKSKQVHLLRRSRSLVHPMVRTRRSQDAPLRVAFCHPDLGLGGAACPLPCTVACLQRLQNTLLMTVHRAPTLCRGGAPDSGRGGGAGGARPHGAAAAEWLAEWDSTAAGFHGSPLALLLLSCCGCWHEV